MGIHQVLAQEGFFRMKPIVSCPLCLSSGVSEYHVDDVRCYLLCGTCALVFVSPEYHLSRGDEKARYELHENSPLDKRYRMFLSRLFDPMLERVPAGGHGLDFGAGPGPTLSVMFQEAGYEMSIYDPFFAPDPTVWDRTYDFITATEVLEHLYRPGYELDRLWSHLRTDGFLGVMTQLVIDRDRFTKWHYTSDPTHVCFFSPETLEWLSASLNAHMTLFPETGVCLFHKRK